METAVNYTAHERASGGKYDNMHNCAEFAGIIQLMDDRLTEPLSEDDVLNVLDKTKEKLKSHEKKKKAKTEPMPS